MRRARSSKRRRTQEERREETRGAVLAATVECLAEVGYARTSTTRIARCARVSRGALLHHYSSKAELLGSAIEFILRRRTEEFRAAFAELPARANRSALAVDLLWRMFSGPTFHAWLELIVAARGDRKLRENVSRISREFADTVARTHRELFPESDQGDALSNLVPAFTFTFLQGLALDRITIGDDPRIEQLLGMLKALAPDSSAIRRTP